VVSDSTAGVREWIVKLEVSLRFGSLVASLMGAKGIVEACIHLWCKKRKQNDEDAILK